MQDYNNMNTTEVQRLARQGDKEALCQMAFRYELMPFASSGGYDAEGCAWNDYWLEKAANAGHIAAKSRYAESLVDRVMNAEDRQKAMGYFQSLVDDFNAGRLNENQIIDGIVAKYWLGIMLCEGYHTRRDPAKGAELIKEADRLSNGFAKFSFMDMYRIGALFASGFAQPGEEPTIEDLEQGIKYLDAAIRRFNPEENRPQYLDGAKELFENSKKWIVTKMEKKSNTGHVDTFNPGAGERRRKTMELSPEARQRMETDKAALARLRQHLAREGW